MQLVDHERDAYRSVLIQLCADLRSHGREVFPEIQIKFGDDSWPEPYRMMRVDALFKKGDKVGPAEASIKNPRRFSPMAETWGALQVTAHPLTWNAVEFQMIGSPPDHEVLFAWLDRWYDKGDTKSPVSDGLFGVVHNITPPELRDGAWSVSIDFGSAPIEAFTTFVDLVQGTGAQSLAFGSFSNGPAAGTA